jgi:hypothetical protein
MLFSVSAMANDNLACANLVADAASNQRQVRNALLRLTNLKSDIDSIVLSHNHGERSQTLVLLLEKPGATESIRRAVIEEIEYLRAQVHVAPRIEANEYVIGKFFLNSETNVFQQRTNSRAGVEPATVAKAKAIRGDEKRLVKFFAGAISFLPTAIFSAISFAADIPGKEVWIPVVSFTSVVAFKHFNDAINTHYANKILDPKREVDLNENRDVSSIYPYEILNQIDGFLAERGVVNDIHVLILPSSLEPGIREHLDKFPRLERITL